MNLEYAFRHQVHDHLMSCMGFIFKVLLSFRTEGNGSPERLKRRAECPYLLRTPHFMN